MCAACLPPLLPQPMVTPATQRRASAPLPCFLQLLFGFGCNLLSSDQFSAVDEGMFYQVWCGWGGVGWAWGAVGVSGIGCCSALR